MAEEIRSLEDLMALIKKFVQERDWEGFQKPSSLAMSAAIEVGELLERFQWLTHDEIAELLKNDDYRISIEDEISDVMIYMIRLADTIGVKPTTMILRKLERNRSKYPVDEWKGKIPDKVRSSR